jgi:hypothetical protein
LLRIAVTVLRTSLSHGPAFGMSRIKRHIQGAVVIGVGVAAAPSPCVIRGKHTAHKGNDGQAMLAIVA